jgi:hypothetical protein
MKLSLSYEQITPTNPEELERLATAGLLDDEALARIDHLGRFFARLGELMADEGARVRDVFTEEELQVIFRHTADPSDAATPPSH